MKEFEMNQDFQARKEEPRGLTPEIKNPYAKVDQNSMADTDKSIEQQAADILSQERQQPGLLNQFGRETNPSSEGPGLFLPSNQPAPRASEANAEKFKQNMQNWVSGIQERHPGITPEQIQKLAESGYVLPGYETNENLPSNPSIELSPQARMAAAENRFREENPEGSLSQYDLLDNQQKAAVDKLYKRDENGILPDRDEIIAQVLNGPGGELKGGDEPIKRERDGYGLLKLNCVEFLAEEIMEYEADARFKAGGEFPLLVEGKFQPDNFLKWVRARMMYYHNEAPDDPHEFGNIVGLNRDISNTSLQNMLNSASRFFRTKDTKDDKGQYVVYQELVEQIKKELWLFGTSRKFDIQYKNIMGAEDGLPQEISKMFYLNTFTKTVWDKKSSLYQVLTMPRRFNKDKNFEVKTKNLDPDEEVNLDTELGRAINLAYLTYYNISDKETLIKLYGKDNPLLDPDRILNRIKEMAEKENLPEDQVATFIDPALTKDFKNPDKDKSEAAILSFINVFNNSGKPKRVIDVVQSLIKDAITEKYELDALDADYANTFAFSMTRWTGAAARNDVAAQGYDAWTRVQNTNKYRGKQLDFSRGGAYGNNHTIHALKEVGANFMTGTHVESMAAFGEKNQLAHKMLLEVLEEMQEAAGNDMDYKNKAKQLVFPENTMRGFAIDHLNRAFTIYTQLQKGEDIKLDKFTEYDYIRGMTFDRAGFDEALKEKFFKPMRYGYSTYSQINFAKEVRALMPSDKNPKDSEYKTVHLGEAMFGREILDIPEFKKKGSKHVSIRAPRDEWAATIDWDHIGSREGRIALWRRVALYRLAAELYAHHDKYSRDPHYGAIYYESVLQALQQIPSDVLGDEFDIHGARVAGHFFTKEEMQWLKHKSHTDFKGLYAKPFRDDLAKAGLEAVGGIVKRGFSGMTKVK